MSYIRSSLQPRDCRMMSHVNPYLSYLLPLLLTYLIYSCCSCEASFLFCQFFLFSFRCRLNAYISRISPLFVYHFFRYPVRDDSIVSIDVKGKHPLPLPEAQSTLALPQELMNDMICIWDFLNNFR